MQAISRDVKWAGIGAAALLATTLPGSAFAVTATDVVCNKCVDNQDMRARAVSGPKLKGDLEIGEWGSAVEPGRIRLRDQNGNNSNPTFEVIDIRADFGIITAGAGPDDGELQLRDFGTATTNGSVTVSLDGGGGSASFGGGTEAGDVFVRDSTGFTTVAISGLSGSMTLGGSSEAGELTVEDTDSLKRISLSGSSAVIDAGGRFDDGELFLRDTGTATTDGNIIINLDGGTGSAFFGGTGENGDVFVRSSSNASNVTLSGFSGDVRNVLGGDGIVKAWARIDADGDVNACDRCSTLPANTQRISPGTYEVDFTIGTVSNSDGTSAGRPVLCSLGHSGDNVSGQREISCVARFGDASSIFVTTRNSTGVLTDSNFTIAVF